MFSFFSPPGHSFLLSAGIAGRRWRGDGAGVHSSSTRLGLWSLVVYGVHGGRDVADPSGRIWHYIIFFLCLMELRWSESEVWRRREMEISVNKAVSGGFGSRR
jgi:hypothetical protein